MPSGSMAHMAIRSHRLDEEYKDLGRFPVAAGCSGLFLRVKIGIEKKKENHRTLHILIHPRLGHHARASWAIHDTAKRRINIKAQVSIELRLNVKLCPSLRKLRPSTELLDYSFDMAVRSNRPELECLH